MKLWTKLAIIAVTFSVLFYPGKALLESFARKRQVSWAQVQSKRCSDLGALLYQYHERNQFYPLHLRELVDSKFVTEARYRELMFQQKPSSLPLEWKYSKPTDLSDATLFSGKPVAVWNCRIRSYIIGRADGSTLVFGEEKFPSMRKRYLSASQLND
jgi:hypothetical protein